MTLGDICQKLNKFVEVGHTNQPVVHPLRVKP